MKSNIYLLFKLILFFTISFVVFYILEYGFAFGSWNKFLGPFLLSGFAAIMFFKPNAKRYILFLIGTCFILMILAYLFNLLDFSNMVGSFGFSLLLVTIVLYLPQIIKKGHVEKF
ncbi:MAG: hypothetical protein Q8P20_07765 [bacterium]|nr:hypothetical protein [bacterium]